MCMTEMNPLEHYTINLGNTYEEGVKSWKDVLERCTHGQKFCRFLGQYSTDQQIWGITGEFKLFSNTSSPGSRFCLDQSAVDDGSIVFQGNVVVFRTMAPRTSNNIFHPIAQGKNSIGFGKIRGALVLPAAVGLDCSGRRGWSPSTLEFWPQFPGRRGWLTNQSCSPPPFLPGGVNYTDQANGKGWTPNSIDVGARSIPVLNGEGLKVMSVMPPTVSPVGNSFAFRGTEAAIVGASICGKMNHRVIEGSEYISMPGLFPRMLDLKFGPDHLVTVDQCRDLGSPKIQTLGDILHFDYYARGGGLFPGWWLSGDTLDQQARNKVFSTSTSDPMTAPASDVCTTAHDSANRCTGPCDVTKVVVDSVVGTLSVGLGVFASFFGDFGFLVKLLGLEVAVGGGTSIMDAAGAESGSLEIQKNTRLFHARLRDTADGFLIRSDATAHDSALTAYLNFPSMLYGCADDDCSGPSGNEVHESAENPVHHTEKAGSYTYTPDNDVWAGDTRLHRTQTVAGNLACSTVDSGSGDFKADISSIHVTDFRRIRASNNMVEFGIVDANTMSELTSGGRKLYALHGSTKATASPFPTSLGPECSLCSSVGSPGETTRPRCSIDSLAEGEAAKNVSYDLSVQGSGVGIDTHARDVFFAPTSDTDSRPKIETTAGVCVYGYFADAGDESIACSDTEEKENVVNRLLGYVVGGDSETIPTSPCISNNDVVEVCSFDTGLRLNDSSFASCQTFPADYNTSCPSPRWANDERVVFPSEISADEEAYPRLPNDFDSKALYTSYCANSWGQTSDSEPFQNKSWFMTSIKKPFLGAPSTWIEDSQMYVYCAGDKLSVEERHAFCGGTEGIPEGRGTYEGLRLENRQTLGQVCKNTGTPSAPKQTCLLYVGDPGPFGNPTRIGDIAAAFPSTDVEIVIVPANFTAVSMMALYLAFVDTTYYNDASYAPPNLHHEAGDAYVIGRKMKLPWSDSAKIVPHMCSSSPDVDFFAHLYAWIERHRNGNSNTYTFFNLDSGTGPGQDQTITMTDAELYPGIQMQGVVKPGLARITVRSAFDSTVAAAAAAILGRESLPPRWAHFRPSPIGGDCTRFRYVSGGILFGSFVPLHTRHLFLPPLLSSSSSSSRSPAWNRGPRLVL